MSTRMTQANMQGVRSKVNDRSAQRPEQTENAAAQSIDHAVPAVAQRPSPGSAGISSSPAVSGQHSSQPFGMGTRYTQRPSARGVSEQKPKAIRPGHAGTSPTQPAPSSTVESARSSSGRAAHPASSTQGPIAGSRPDRNIPQGSNVPPILEILKEFKYLRVRQLHALVQAHYRTQGIKIDERRMEIMLRQMRTGTNYVWLRGDVVSYGDRRIDPRLLEALDVMLELTKAQPGFYSKDGLHEPFLLRFTGNGKGAGYLFSVAWLDAATHIATVPRMKGERIIWISESGSFGEIDLPRHHFFAARQKDGTHRFFGSNEPEKI